jgi:hypothetical protein
MAMEREYAGAQTGTIMLWYNLSNWSGGADHPLTHAPASLDYRG